MKNRVLRSFNILMLLVIFTVIGFFLPVKAKAGPLNIEEGIQYLYDAAKERGVIATLWDWNGNKSAAVALKYAVFHNKAKTLHFASLLVGMEVTLENRPRGRYLITPSLNLIDCSRWLWERDRIKTRLTVTSGPKGWEFYVGPQIRPPQKKWDQWTWGTHTGWLASIGTRLGGKPLESVE